MEKKIKNLEYYKRLPYRLYVQPAQDSDDSKYWTAEYVELRGCKTDGDTEAEAVLNLQELFDEYISGRIEDVMDIPEPPHITVTVEDINIWVRHEDRTPATKETSSELKPEIVETELVGV